MISSVSRKLGTLTTLYVSPTRTSLRPPPSFQCLPLNGEANMALWFYVTPLSVNISLQLLATISSLMSPSVSSLLHLYISRLPSILFPLYPHTYDVSPLLLFYAATSTWPSQTATLASPLRTLTTAAPSFPLQYID